MLFDIIFYCYFVMVLLLVLFLVQYVLIAVLQLYGYIFKSFVKFRLNYISKNILWYFFIVLLATFLSVVCDNYYQKFNVVLLVISGCILSVFYINQIRFFTVIFTKRILRLYSTICVLDILILCFLFKCFDVCNICVLFDVFLLCSCLVVWLAYFINLPVEKLISNRYVKLAKEKLRQNKQLVKIGITGSYGKTSVKEILNKILSSKYSTLATPKSYNTIMGVSKTINNNLKSTTEVFVCEMGAKQSGDILELCNLVSVDIGIVTAVGNQHIETFKSIDAVYKTKKELPDFLHNKTCVFNLMNVYTRKMYYEYVGRKIGAFVLHKVCFKRCVGCVKKKLFSMSVYKGVLYQKLHFFPIVNNYYAKVNNVTENGSNFMVYYSGNKLGEMSTHLLGLHNVLNILMAIGVAMELSVPFYRIKAAVECVDKIAARTEKYITNKGSVVINNGYNSNINSAESTLDILNLFKNKTKVVVTPGLIETGDDFAVNRRFGSLVGRFADEVIIVKETNKDAIMLGLSDNCFDMSKVYSVKSFNDAKAVIEMAGDNYVFLIENDLPNNYK